MLGEKKKIDLILLQWKQGYYASLADKNRMFWVFYLHNETYLIK